MAILILKSITFIFKSAFPRAAHLNSYKVSAESRQRNSFTMTNSLILYIYLFQTGSCLFEIGTAPDSVSAWFIVKYFMVYWGDKN